MFTNLRILSKKPVAKIFLLSLAISLSIWGIKVGTDNQNHVAIIGSDNYITIENFRKAKINFIRETQQKYNQQNFENSNINQIILNILIQNELLKAETASLGLVIGEGVALKILRKMPIFKNKNDKFDKEIFKRTLAMKGISAAQLIANIKNDLSTNILNSVFTDYLPSENLIREFFNYKEQKRIIDLVLIKSSKDINEPNIKDKDIEAYYHSNKNKFTVPESRDIEYILITPDAYKEKVKLLEEEIKNELANDNNTSKTNKELSTKIKENLLTNKINKLLHTETKKIEEEIAAGSNLKEIATKYNLKYHLIEKLNNNNNEQRIPQFNGFLDQAFSTDENYPSEAFAIDENQISSGYYILNTSKIYNTHHKKLNEETKKNIVTFIKEEHKEKIAREHAIKLYNTIISGKKSLEDISKEYTNISVQEMTLNRLSSDIDLNLLIDVFKLKEQNSYTNMLKSKEPYIFQFAIVKKIQLPQQKPSSEQTKIIETQLTNLITTSIHQEFLNYLYQKHKVKIFPKTLEKL